MELINDILWWCLWSALLLQAYILLFNKGIPNFKTAPSIRKAITQILKQQRKAKNTKDFTIIDLGCGNGKFTREIAKAIPDAHVIGIEIGKIPYMTALFWKKIHKLDNLEYVNSDFNSYNTSNADAIVMYLAVHFMDEIEDKLQRELKPKSYVISNSFRFRKNWQPIETHEAKTYRHGQGRFYIYQK